LKPYRRGLPMGSVPSKAVINAVFNGRPILSTKEPLSVQRLFVQHT